MNIFIFLPFIFFLFLQYATGQSSKESILKKNNSTKIKRADSNTPEYQQETQDTIGEEPQIRVLIAKEDKSRFLLKKNLFEIKDDYFYLFGTKYKYNKNKSIDFEIDKQKYILINGYRYTGKFKIIGQNGLFEVINLLPLEDYLAGVLASEISYSWKNASIQAQAIVSRTYAYYLFQNNQNQNYDIKATINHQVFKGNFDVHPKIIKNVVKSKGIIITYNGEAFQTFFHASCGGMTTTPKNVWGGKNLGCFDYVKCNHCTSHPKYKWNYFLKNKFVKKFQIDRISIHKRDKSLRVTKMFFISKKSRSLISGKEIRQIIGGTEFLSTRFNFYKERKQFIFIGTGYGHGVGLCQWGAKVMAEKGFSASAILNKYYRNINSKKIY